MYEHVFHFFGLRENPFHVSPDPRFFFSTKAHGSALTQLKMGVDTRQGFVVLIGEAGTGKTILLHRFLNWLQSREQSSSYIFQSQLKPLELFESILHDFGVPYGSRRKGDLLAALRQWLVQRHAMGDSPVLIIDEAQAISLRTLDRLRMLLNLEIPGSKLLQIVLAGQPELEAKLHRPELRQLHQRIMFRCTLLPLSLEETVEYVKSRLANCGAKDTKLFSDESMEAIHMYAQGIPRVVNLLCEHALLVAHAEKQNVITSDVISRVAATFELTSQHSLPREQKVSPSFVRLDPVRIDEKTTPIVPEIAVLAEQKAEVKSSPLVARNVQEKNRNVSPKSDSTLIAQRPTFHVAAPAGKSSIVRAPKNQVASSPIIARKVPAMQDQQVRAEAGPVLMVQEPIVNAAAATGAAVIVRTPETQVPSSPIVARKAPALQEQQVRPKAGPVLRVQKPIVNVDTATGAAVIVRTPENHVPCCPIIAEETPSLPDQKASQPTDSKKLATTWKCPSWSARFLYYCGEVEQSFVRDWKQFLRTYTQAKKAPGPGSPSV